MCARASKEHTTMDYLILSTTSRQTYVISIVFMCYAITFAVSCI